MHQSVADNSYAADEQGDGDMKIPHAYLDLRPLYFFSKVAELGSFSRAAPEIGVSQPALSREIKGLEELYNTVLFHRNGRGVALTDAGEKLFDLAQTMFAHVKTTQDAMNQYCKAIVGDLTIVIPPSYGESFVFDIVQEFRSAYPSIAITIREGLCADALQWLANGDVDLGILYSAPMLSTLVSQQIGEDRLVLVGLRDALDQESGTEIAFSEITKIPLLLPPQPHKIRSELELAALAQEVRLRIEVNINGMAALREMINRGAGFTILPYGLIYSELDRLSFWPIVKPEIRPQVFLTHSMQKPLSMAARALIKAILARFRVKDMVGIPRAVIPAHHQARAGLADTAIL